MFNGNVIVPTPLDTTSRWATFREAQTAHLAATVACGSLRPSGVEEKDYHLVEQYHTAYRAAEATAATLTAATQALTKLYAEVGEHALTAFQIYLTTDAAYLREALLAAMPIMGHGHSQAHVDAARTQLEEARQVLMDISGAAVA